MKNRIQQGFTLIELLVVITIIAILAGLALPTFTKIQEKGNMTKAISNCRQIITVLRIYSSDNGGNYPDNAATADAGAGGAGGGGGGGTQNSNDVFRQLFVAGSIDTEAIFGCPASKDGNPDGNIGTAPGYDEAVKPGENHWAMTAGLSDSASGTYPLVYENPSGGAWPEPTWNADAAGLGTSGRTWSAGKVIIGMNDSSVGTEATTSPKGSGLQLKGKANNAPNVFKQNEQSNSGSGGGGGGGGGGGDSGPRILMAATKQ
jgi:prepilin-type N-terminal cleavage/methylation domain-containing protein